MMVVGPCERDKPIMKRNTAARSTCFTLRVARENESDGSATMKLTTSMVEDDQSTSRAQLRKVFRRG
jgi:hypothetical protein